MSERSIARVRPERRSGVALPGSEGPTLICTAAIHGNERSGVGACRAVAASLRELRPGAFRGEFVGLVGNVRALDRGVRFVHEDLNRHWTPTQFRRAHELAAREEETATDEPGPAPMLAEDRELVELTRAVRRVVDRARGTRPGSPGVVALLDLHTTSGESAPFLAAEDELSSRRLALRLPIPTVIGLEERLSGLFMSWFVASGRGGADGGRPGLVFEAGRHDDPDSARRHEAAIWLTLEALGMLDSSADRAVVERIEASRACLAPLGADVPRTMHLVHRHAVAEGSRFAMRPGYVNFQAVTRGETLADDKAGEIRSPITGRIFMPLYQEQGEDGFLIVRSTGRLFLRASLAARSLHLERLLRFLPGVRRSHGGLERGTDAFIVRPGIAAKLRPVFALLGYRRRRELNRSLVLLGRRSVDV